MNKSDISALHYQQPGDEAHNSIDSDIYRTLNDPRDTIQEEIDVIDFGEMYTPEYREKYWKNIESNAIDYITNNDIEENIDFVLQKKLNLDRQSEDYVLRDLVKRYPELENAYERVCLQYYVSGLKELNIEYFVCQWLSKYPELKRNDIKFKEYLPQTRLREIKAQYFLNNLIDTHPELKSTADRFKDYESSPRLREVNAQYMINNWIKDHPEFQSILDSKKNLSPSTVIKFMQYNN